jgi:hypothetical protein
VNRSVYFFLGNVWFCPIKDSSLIRACRDTIPATDAPVVIHHDDPVRFLPRGMDRTYFYTGRILALLALNGEIDESFFWNQFRVIIMFGVFKIDQVSSLEPENSDPLELGVMAGRIVFFHTGINTSSAANTSGKLQAICPKSIGNRFLRADLKFPPIFLQVSLFQLCNDTFLFFLGHLAEMFLQKILSLLLCAGGEERKRKACQGG